MMRKSAILKKSLQNGSYVFVQKLLSFLCNTFIQRRLQTHITGIADIQLVLLSSTIFVFREGFRLAFLRAPSLEQVAQYTPHKLQALVNMAWISTTMSALLSAFIILIVNHFPTLISSDTNALADTITLYCLAAAIEAVSEPLYLLSHASLYVSWHVLAQSLGLFARTIVQYIGVFVYHKELYALAMSEIARAIVSFSVLVFCFHQKMHSVKAFAIQSWKQLFPRRTCGLNEIALEFPEIWSRLVPLSVQSLLKYLLTEGDKWFLSCFASFEMMGVFGIVSQLGGLVCRLIFFPMEEALRAVMSKVELSDSRRILAKDMEIFWIALRMMNLIGLFFICFGSFNTETLILLLLGKEKVDSGVADALSVYCVYVYIMGVNGVSEAFVHAIASKEELGRLNQTLNYFFLIYAVSAYAFMTASSLYSIGLILSNCLSMLCRISQCLYYVARYANEKSPTMRSVLRMYCDTCPSRSVLYALAFSSVVEVCSYRAFVRANGGSQVIGHVKHVSVGICCASIVLSQVYRKEKKHIKPFLEPLKRSKSQ